MAGPSIGTWVKVRNKSGRTTARVIAKKFGGGSYSQGEVITQSEYNSYKDKRAEGMKAEASGGGGGQAKARLPKAALSKQEKTSILLKNKKRIKAEASKSPDNYSQINRMNRLEKADRARRKAENPNAPAFKRARKAADTRRKNASGGGGGQAKARLPKAALSKQEKTSILLKNKKRIKAEASKSPDNYSQINRMNRLEKADRARRKAENPNAPAFKRARTAADTRRANARRKEEARR